MTLRWTLLLKEGFQVSLHYFFVLELYDRPVHFVSQLHVFFLSKSLLFLLWIEADFRLTFELNGMALGSRCYHVVPRLITRHWFFGLGHWSFRECDRVKFLAVLVSSWAEYRVPQVGTLASNLSSTILWHLIVRRVVGFIHSSRRPAAINCWSVKSLLIRTCRWHWLLGRESKRWRHCFIFAELGTESASHSIPDGSICFHF